MDVQLDNNNDLDDEEAYFDEEEDEPIVEVPRQSRPIEEVYLSDDELPNGNVESVEPEGDFQKDEDIVFLDEVPKNEEHSSNSSSNISLHPDITETWKLWTRYGIPLNDKRELLQKYCPPKVLQTPEINQEILVTLHKRPIDKDEHIRTSQDLLSSALTALGSTMSTLLVEKDGSDRLKVMNSLNDTAKLLTELFHFDTDKRRSQLISWKSKPLQSVLADTKPDEFLFGSDLQSKLDEAQQLGIIGPLKPYVYKKRNNNLPRRSFPSPYHWFGKDEEENEDEEQNFVLNPLKQEDKFVCKKEEFPIIKLE